jgi:hypothetical protein
VLSVKFGYAEKKLYNLTKGGRHGTRLGATPKFTIRTNAWKIVSDADESFYDFYSFMSHCACVLYPEIEMFSPERAAIGALVI